VARKGLPADPDMAEMFTTLFVEFDKEVQEQRFLETVRPFPPLTHRSSPLDAYGCAGMLAPLNEPAPVFTPEPPRPISASGSVCVVRGRERSLS
jgi:hypothetical protein